MKKRLLPSTQAIIYKVLPAFTLVVFVLMLTKSSKDSIHQLCSKHANSLSPCAPRTEPSSKHAVQKRKLPKHPFQYMKDSEETISWDDFADSDNGFKNKILVFTSYRTGSSFTGELFKQNPSVFYLFEPLKLTSLISRNGFLQDRIVDYLDDNFSCKFARIINDSKRLFPRERKLRASWFSKVFEQPLKRHGDLSVRNMEALCRQYSIHAIKIIRANKIETVFPLMEKGVKVINLIRDPRGAATSRFEIEAIKSKQTLDYYWRSNENKVLNSVKSECARYAQLHDVITGKSVYHTDQDKLLQNTYRLVRYEDIAYHPKHIAKELYKYLNLKMPKEVQTWLNRSTSTDTEGNVDLHRAYSTSRNSKSNAEAWRTKMPLIINLQIQAVCDKVLQNYGYKSVDSLVEYRNLKLSLVNRLVKGIKYAIK